MNENNIQHLTQYILDHPDLTRGECAKLRFIENPTNDPTIWDEAIEELRGENNPPSSSIFTNNQSFHGINENEMN